MGRGELNKYLAFLIPLTLPSPAREGVSCFALNSYKNSYKICSKTESKVGSVV